MYNIINIYLKIYLELYFFNINNNSYDVCVRTYKIKTLLSNYIAIL